LAGVIGVVVGSAGCVADPHPNPGTYAIGDGIATTWIRQVNVSGDKVGATVGQGKKL
jgi:hypothetical protein